MFINSVGKYNLLYADFSFFVNPHEKAAYDIFIAG